jgi:hypothetical protein
LNFRLIEPSEFEQLKERLLREQLSGEKRPELFPVLRRAANDAAALAWAAPFPNLVFPELFREKLAAARRYVKRQASVRRRGQPTARGTAEAEVAA